ncbi:hypothetical protein [Flagellimonas myxillae]|uniref:hypothetical protein n=1 Tax=Flagellimonas myxillae TaxID=2942214 RepID=UPI00201E8825|nr:hypothetical protein [Muricauda myxillae]MCL6266562.1 hypothetical protein [Muricauda myxillae]
MKKIITLSLIALFLTNCKDQGKKQATELDDRTEAIEEEQQTRRITQNYAVVFNWATKNEKLVMENSMLQSDQLRKLWEDGIVENVYYDAEAKYDKFSYFPNITFTLKATDETEAKTILDGLVVVEKGIATYTTYPVGTLWLKRNEEAIKERGGTSSFVAVWNTDYKPERTMVVGQNEKLMELWNSGQIENVYFDIEGTQKENDKTDFVFFVNANTEEEAKSIIDPLPFVRNAVASYKLYPVGIFWMGTKE